MSISQEARLALLGWSFRGAGVSVRERVAFTADEVREALTDLLKRGVISEGVIVSTCHRSEIYSFASDDQSRDGLTRYLSEWRGLEQAELEGSCFYRVGGDAARHLFRVAAGLDSLALGESEVLGQVRQALSLARESGSTRAVMHRLFESAVAAGKRVRSETEIARHPLSVSSIGFELAKKVFGDLSQRQVLVIGAGETGSLFARHAVEAGVRGPVIVNRTAFPGAGAGRERQRTRRRVGAPRERGRAGRRRRQRDVEPRASRHAGAGRVGDEGSARPADVLSRSRRARATSRPTSRRSTTSSPTRSTTWRRSRTRTARGALGRSRWPRRSWRRSWRSTWRGSETSRSCRP